MQLKVNNCGECPFKQFDSDDDNFYCEHPEGKDVLWIEILKILHQDCPEGGAFEIKTSPITIKIEEKNDTNK